MATLKRTVAEFREDNLTDWAAALTYYSVLSVFPALIALVSIVGLVGDPQTITKQLTDIVTSIGPASAADTFKQPIEDITKSSGTAGILLIVGIATALWTASGYVGAFMRASNAIYEVEEGRSFFKLRPLQMLVTLVLVLLLAVVLLALVLTGPVAEKVGSAIGVGEHRGHDLGHRQVAGAGGHGPARLRDPLLLGPERQAARASNGSPPGSLLALVVWLIASAGFAFYVSNFGSYNKTYGTLGGIIAFLVWVWITNVAILLGAELNAERERSREIDAGLPGAERELQLEERTEPKQENRARTA